ncbi:MAG: hypothetical protein DRN29_00020 [Thermoplasmata archaeon]|nr:MAG: hypothetical protein DRN29_00020 [Thermoplasmata archaeon]
MHQWKMRRILCIAVLIFFLFPAYSLKITDKKNASQDLDPLVDVHVSVKIKRIRTIDCEKNVSLFVKVKINELSNTSQVWENVMDIEPEWTAIQDVPDDVANVTIQIELWKKEGGNEVQCDINGGNGKSLTLIYDIKRGEWTGDDFRGDIDGYGHANGVMDGVCDENDCELWFTITQNDYDNDSLTYWEETFIYGTNPMLSDYGKDYDNDGVPIEWEDYWGYDPFKKEEHSILDPDNDGLYNTQEWLTSQWLSDPFHKDIFVEVDWMEGKNIFTKPYKMPFLSKEYLFSAFSKHNITLHIDDGCMGGGEQIPYSYEPNLRSIYVNYFLHGIKNRWRHGIFHYAILCGVNPWKKNIAGFNFQQDAFVVCIGTIRAYRVLKSSRTTATASLFMHELGHNLGLFSSDFPGIDNESCNYPWRKGWWVYADYKSCMNYRYAWHLVDYSNGTHGEIDYDDWGNLNFYHFKE